jgi:hypothetical protein
MTENFQEGCILLSRSLLNSAVFQNEKWLKVWVWCLAKANHKKQMVPITTGKGQTVVEIDRGQFIFGRHKASESLKMNPSTVRNIMDKLEKLQNIAMQKDTHYTIVTICNYEDYQNLENYKGQAKGQPKDNQRTTKGQPKDTNKNVKNDNNENNDKIKEYSLYGEFNNVKLIEENYQKLVKKYNGKLAGIIETMSQHLETKSKDPYKGKDHYAAILKNDHWLDKGKAGGFKSRSEKNAEAKAAFIDSFTNEKDITPTQEVIE